MKNVIRVVKGKVVSRIDYFESGPVVRQEVSSRSAAADYGPPLWADLHRRALTANPGSVDTVWLAQFARQLPCGACRSHWLDMMRRTPPTWSDYFAWTVERHNEVNARLSKPRLAMDAALKIWSAAERVS